MQNVLSYFSGRDGFTWFIGVCEDRDDPVALGRVRVRVFGYHTDDLIKLPTQDLPWAQVVLPPTAKPGELPNITPGQWVFGFFRDPDYLQEPVVLGILTGSPASAPDPSRGFSDPNSTSAPDTQDAKYRATPDFGPYPLATGEPDTNRLIVNNTNRPHPLLATRVQEQIPYLSIPTSAGPPWALPEYPYATRYPYNHVFQSESGHIREYDDTPKNERIHERHRTGTFYEIDGGGNKTTKVVGDNFEVIVGSENVYVKGEVNLTVESNCNTYIKGDWNVRVDGNVEHIIKGTKKEIVFGAVTEQYDSTQSVSVKGAVTNIYGSTFNEHIKSAVTLDYLTNTTQRIGGTYDFDVSGAVTMDSASTFKINQPSETQNAARKGDDVPDSEVDGTQPIGVGSASVFIGDIGVASAVVETDLLPIEVSPVQAVQAAYGLPSLNITEGHATAVLNGRIIEQINGIDPNTNEGVEYGDGGTGGTSPVTGQSGAITAPPATENDGNNFEDVTKTDNYDGDLLIFLPHTDPRIDPRLRTILENTAREWGAPLTITSAYRNPEYNASVGGAKLSMHSQGYACDVRLANTSIADRQRFIRIASSKGIQGFGCYFPASGGGNFIHCDIGAKRHWGPTGSRASQYGWALETLRGAGY